MQNRTRIKKKNLAIERDYCSQFYLVQLLMGNFRIIPKVRDQNMKSKEEQKKEKGGGDECKMNANFDKSAEENTVTGREAL